MLTIELKREGWTRCNKQNRSGAYLFKQGVLSGSRTQTYNSPSVWTQRPLIFIKLATVLCYAYMYIRMNVLNLQQVYIYFQNKAFYFALNKRVRKPFQNIETENNHFSVTATRSGDGLKSTTYHNKGVSKFIFILFIYH